MRSGCHPVAYRLSPAKAAPRPAKPRPACQSDAPPTEASARALQPVLAADARSENSIGTRGCPGGNR